MPTPVRLAVLSAGSTERYGCNHLVMRLGRASKLAAACVGITLLVACGDSRSANVAPKPVPTWAAADLAGVPDGFRGAAYDSSGNSLWITSRYFTDAASAPRVKLIKLNVVTGAAVATSVDLPGIGYITGLVAVDQADQVWMAWGRT